MDTIAKLKEFEKFLDDELQAELDYYEALLDD